MIIGINGYIGSGKDTVGKIIQDLITRAVDIRTHDDLSEVKTIQSPLFVIKKFAEKLKIMASIMLNVPVERFEDQDFKNSKLPEEWDTYYPNEDRPEPMTIRQFLQKLGTDAIRNNLHKNAWVNSAMVDYSSDKNWIFTDVRFPNEAKAIKDRGGFIIRINRYIPGVSTKFLNLHESEIALDDWDFDYTIWNNGTIEDLIGQVKNILKGRKLL